MKKLLNWFYDVGMFWSVVVCASFVIASCITSFPAHAQQNTSNLSALVLPSAIRSATAILSLDQANCCYKGANVFINTSVWTAGTYTITLQGKDTISGQYYTILTSATFGTPTGLTVLHVYPGFPVTANVSANDVLPRTWRVSLTGASSPNMVLSVGASLIP